MLVVCDCEDETLLDPLLASVAQWEYGRTPPDSTRLQDNDGFYLHFEQGLLRLCQLGATGCAMEFAELRRRGRGLSELVKACIANSKGQGVKILDVFAGWGIDAWQLAAHGASVECWESDGVVCALLRDSWRRAPANLKPRVQVNHGPAQRRLAAQATVDVVYLDPMFPPHRTKALPHKRLQYLSRLVAQSAANTVITSDAQLHALITSGQRIARERVVLKRRRNDPAWGKPDWQIKGTSVRYDVYRGAA